MAVRIYWYWPWPFHRALALAEGAVRSGDHLTLQALRSRHDPPLPSPTERLAIVADLPEPRPLTELSPRWAVDRMTMLARRARRRRSLVRATQFDVSHVHLLNPLIDPFALPSLRRAAPLVSSVHDVFPHQRRFPDRVQRSALRRIYANAGSLIVYHGHLKSLLVNDFEVDPHRITVIPHPVREFRGDGLRGDTTKRVLFFGAIRRNKGVPVLLEAIDRLRDLREVEFVFAGRGVAELEDQITAAARADTRITAHLRFIPNDERDQLYGAADLVVLPYSAFASQSGVLADAYSYGVPLLATDVGALGDSIREDRTGWIISPGDVSGLAAGIRRALDDEAAVGSIRARMAAIADERSESATAAAFRAVYDRAVAASAVS